MSAADRRSLDFSMKCNLSFFPDVHNIDINMFRIQFSVHGQLARILFFFFSLKKKSSNFKFELEFDASQDSFPTFNNNPSPQ